MKKRKESNSYNRSIITTEWGNLSLAVPKLTTELRSVSPVSLGSGGWKKVVTQLELEKSLSLS